jgi:hypothetical protein
MIGAFGTSTDGSTTTLYLHGHISSRFFKLASTSANSSNKSQHWEEDGLPGLPVCICATHVDGLVLALTPFNHSINYRSAVIHGYASLVTDPEEKNYAFHLITDNVIPDRWVNTRVPLTEAEAKATGVVKVQVVSASAKVRAHTVSNDKTDLENDAVREKVWTGVIPAYVKYGEPVPARENAVDFVPPHVAKWIEETNTKGEAYSREIASLPKP